MQTLDSVLIPAEDFKDDSSGSKHWEFQVWRQENLEGYFLTFGTQKKARLHRAVCWHQGHPHFEDPSRSFTAKRKVCDLSNEVLLAWTKREGIETSQCQHCMAHSFEEQRDYLDAQFPLKLGTEERKAPEIALRGAQPTDDESDYVARSHDLLRSNAQLERPTGLNKPTKTAISTAGFQRCPKVRAWALRRSDYTCECCGDEPAFVTDDGIPYLEVHHLVPLAEEGPDTPDNVAAVCANCHRALHLASHRDELLAGTRETVRASEASMVA